MIKKKISITMNDKIIIEMKELLKNPVLDNSEIEDLLSKADDAISLRIKDITETSKSYSHKPHLSLLPYDLNTNDPKKLKERLRAIRAELRACRREKDTWDESIKGWEKDIKDWTKDKEDMQKQFDKGAEIRDEIRDHIHSVRENAVEDNKQIKQLYADFMKYDKFIDQNEDVDMKDLNAFMGQVFNGRTLSGYMPPSTVDNVNKMADNLEKIMNSATLEDSDDYDNWQAGGMELVSSMRQYGKDYNLEGDGENTAKFTEIVKREGYLSSEDMADLKEKMNENDYYLNDAQESIKENYKERSKVETKINDFKEQEQRTKDKLEKVTGKKD